MKRIVSLVLVVLLFSGGSITLAQQKGAHMSFDTESHDFGKFKEESGPVSYKFTFTNTGNVPLVIQDVRASCGCTTPSWTKKPVIPGGTGFISATYNPSNRPGAFEKTITVTSNADPSVDVLHIKGEVIPKEKTVEELYPVQVENIRMKTNHFAFSRIYSNQKETKNIDIVNTSGEPATISFTNVPSYIKMEATPSTLKPGEKGIISATYDAAAKHQWGYMIDRLNMSVNGKSPSMARITVTANIEEDFSSLTPEQKASAPHISFDESNFDFGKVKQGEKVEHSFSFTNTGKSDLIIRNVKASCGCTAVTPENSVIKAGETSSIKAIFNSAGKHGRQNKTITVITNDPDNSKVILWIRGEVESQ
ncbi:MAG TPA: DUF1573 domain-containing protein [Bacteroidales bacterium]|nr:DUF1573 domain-containing protein [Bacteroidales bacterium]